MRVPDWLLVQCWMLCADVDRYSHCNSNSCSHCYSDSWAYTCAHSVAITIADTITNRSSDGCPNFDSYVDAYR
jgi:hypothetical protein